VQFWAFANQRCYAYNVQTLSELFFSVDMDFKLMLQLFLVRGRPRLLPSFGHNWLGGSLALPCFAIAILVASVGYGQEDNATKVPTVNVEFKHKFGQTTSVGEIIVEAEDGGLLLLTPDGQLWTLQPEDILSRSDSKDSMKAQSSEGIDAKFKLQAADGFKVHKTSHYVIIFNTSEAYAQWVGEMYEGLYRKFHNFWKSKKIELEEPRFPLVAIVFNTKEA